MYDDKEHCHYGYAFFYFAVRLIMIEGYTTVAEIAKRWGVKPRTVQIMCAEGRIAGVTKFGRAWAIPVDADKPKDNRISTGEYKDWRKTQKNSEE